MKMLQLAGLAVVVLLFSALPAFAAENSYFLFGGGIAGGLGMGLTIIGAGYGFGRIGSAALESMARQPEVAGRIQTAMIIVAAMLEGATLASVVFCLLVGLKTTF